MTSMYTPTIDTVAVRQFALVAQVVASNDVATSGNARLRRVHVLDHAELTDLVAEAIAESQRVHGAHGQTLWGDAAEAASLILQHVAALCGVDPGWSDSESKFLGGGGVSDNHV